MEAKCINLSILLILSIIVLVYDGNAHEAVIFNITDYGATPEADISQALSDAWKDANVSEIGSKIVIPSGTWILSEAILQGPNLAPIALEIKGTINANPNIDNDNTSQKPHDWITINHVDFFTLSGNGVLDGQGHQAWLANNCKSKKKCTRLPRNLSLNNMKNSVIQDVTTKDSKFFHINCNLCTNTSFIRVTVSAPGNSPNTDGIHVARSRMIHITDSVIGTGDDCISMGNDLTDVNIRNVSCGPGHGISIGSLGEKADERDVSGICVKNCTFINTTNGVRIKTFPSTPGTLQVSDVHFEDLVMDNVKNPIIIDQNYCPNNQCDPTEASLVQIRNVTIDNVRGSTSSKNAVTMWCSSARPCIDVQIGNINLSHIGNQFEKLNSTCANIRPLFFGEQIPPICVTFDD